MSVKIKTITTAFIAAVSLTSCTKPVPKDFTGIVSLVVGKAEISHNGKTDKLSAGDGLMPGDLIKTGPRSVVIAVLGKNLAHMEIQENAEFYFTGSRKNLKELHMKKGNLWLRVNRKLEKGQGFRVHSPVSVAAVRGTKFYTFNAGDIYGTCVCRGSIHYDAKEHSFNKEESMDTLILTRGKKTVSFIPENMPNDGSDPHRHSDLNNSPLGPQKKMSRKQIEAFLKYLNSKLDEPKQ